MTAEIKLGKEIITVKNGQAISIGGRTISSMETGTWVHPVGGDYEKFGKVKQSGGAVGLYAPGSSIETSGLKVEHVK